MKEDWELDPSFSPIHTHRHFLIHWKLLLEWMNLHKNVYLSSFLVSPLIDIPISSLVYDLSPITIDQTSTIHNRTKIHDVSWRIQHVSWRVFSVLLGLFSSLSSSISLIFSLFSWSFPPVFSVLHLHYFSPLQTKTSQSFPRFWKSNFSNGFNLCRFFDLVSVYRSETEREWGREWDLSPFSLSLNTLFHHNQDDLSMREKVLTFPLDGRWIDVLEWDIEK